MDDIYLGTLKAGDVKKVGTELSSVFFLIFFFRLHRKCDKTAKGFFK